MTAPEQLKDKEKAVLRLVLRGYDAKLIARELNLSVHTVNERLRDARRALGVSSSREAALMLDAAERGTAAGWAVDGPNSVGDNSVGDKAFGDAADRERAHDAPTHGNGALGQRERIIMAIGLLGAAAGVWALVTTSGAPDVASVAASTAPRVVSVAPAQGATVAPGRTDVVVTFDQPMARNSFSFVQRSNDSFPDCAKVPQQSTDGRTFTLRCRTVAGRSYAVGINTGSYRNFRSLSGVPAQGQWLTFQTRAKP